MSEAVSLPWVAIQRNPASGTSAGARRLLELVRVLRAHGLRPRLFTRRERLATVLEDPARRAALRCLIAAGGDGTCRDLLNRYPDLPVAIFPLGTENLLARYCGYDRDPQRLAQTIKTASVRVLDGGLFGTTPASQQRFVVMASAGFDAAIIHEVHAGRRGHLSRLTYVLPILRVLWHYRHPTVRVWIDDEPTPRVGRIVVIVNLPLYALGIRVATTAVDDDAQLDVRLFQGGTAWQMWRYFWHLMCGTHETLPDVISVRARKIRLESDGPVPLQVDGDPAGTTPQTFAVAPATLRVVWPRSNAESPP